MQKDIKTNGTTLQSSGHLYVFICADMKLYMYTYGYVWVCIHTHTHP